MNDVELQIGAQTRAAQVLAARLPELDEVTRPLIHALEADLARFQGQAAGALGEALQAWFVIAAELPQMLVTYGEALVSVDNTMADSESSSASHYGSFTRRLEGL